MRSTSTAERSPKSSEPSVAVGLPMRTPSISTSVSPGLAPRRRTWVTEPTPPASSTSRPATPRSTSASPLVPSFCTSEAGITVTEAPVWPIGSSTRSAVTTISGNGSARAPGENVAESTANAKAARDAGRDAALNMAPPAVPPTAVWVARSKAGLLAHDSSPLSSFPGRSRSQWMNWRAARRLQLRGQPRLWSALKSEPHRVPVGPARAGPPMTLEVVRAFRGLCKARRRDARRLRRPARERPACSRRRRADGRPGRRGSWRPPRDNPKDISIPAASSPSSSNGHRRRGRPRGCGRCR